MSSKMTIVDSDDDKDGIPLIQMVKSNRDAAEGGRNRKRSRPLSEESELSTDDDDEEEEEPPTKRYRSNGTSSTSSATAGNSTHRNGYTNGSAKRQSAMKSSPQGSSPSSDSDDVPLTAMRNGKAPAVADSSDEDGVPLAPSQATTPPKPKLTGRMQNKKGKVKPKKEDAKGKAAKSRSTGVKSESDAEDSEDDDDEPLASLATSKKPVAAANGKRKASPPAKAPPSKRVKPKKEESASEVESQDSDSDAPIGRKRRPSARAAAGRSNGAPPSKATKVKPEPPATPVRAKAKATKDAKATPKGKKKEEVEKEEEDQEDIHKWWEQQQIQGDGSIKWTTLEHNGVLFPPPYAPLPSGVKMKYNGEEVTLSPEAEEVAGFFAALLETDHAADAKFQENFFRDWLQVIKDNPTPDSLKIQEFTKCDFRPMHLHFEAEKVAKKALSSAEKKALKAAKDKMEAPYTECVLDGRKEKVGNFRIEPPGLFRGRGEHPKKGCLKFRVRPEDIVLNLGATAKVPEPNAPGKWGKVVNDQTVTWLANWKENVNGNFKYVFLAAGSSLKGQSDMAKFEKARELKVWSVSNEIGWCAHRDSVQHHVDRIRQDYTVDLKSRITADRQRATAMYFIDKLALRAGNEKGEDEADTVGCCSLRYEHVTLRPPNELIFDFLGKDSIRYYNTVEVDPQVFKNMRIFKGDGKTEKDAIFDRVTPTTLNKHLQSYMKGLTAKVFRTYNASITFQQQLDAGTPESGTDAEKLAAYHEANRMVAILCNHQKSVSKTFGASMEKLSDKLRGMKYQRMKLRRALFTLDPKQKKKHPELLEDESDVDDEFVAYWEEEQKKTQIAKATKKFEKTNEALIAEGKEPESEKVLKGVIAKIEEEYEELVEQRGKTEVALKGYKDVDKVFGAIEKLDTKIKAFKVNMDVKDKGKDVSLGTSKINYLDPRITTAWCKKHDIPVSKLFSKTLLAKFPWAMEAQDDWKF
ncbi:DNA topoisomerase 1 [Tulasnella sp. 403]|nr:DNA topoisomerase 1 [Tulasnella sp. 403]